MKEAPNAFLEEQKKIMQQREQFRAEAKAIAVGTRAENEPGYDPNAPTRVATFDAGMNIISTREIQNERTLPARIQKPALPSLAVIRRQLENLITELQESKEDYQNLSLDQYYAPLKDLEAEQSRLRTELDKVEADIAEFKSHGTPKQSYTDHVVRSEHEVMQIAGLLLTKLTDEALATFKVPADRLSPETRKDLSLQFEDRLQRFANTFYTRTGRAKNLTDAQLTERSEQLVVDLETIAKENL